MWAYIIITLLSFVLIFGLTACFPGKTRISGFHDNDSLFYPADSSFGKSSRADIERRLQMLAESSVPSNLNPGAMCYEMAAIPDVRQYVCPVCGQKTLYTKSDQFYIIDNVEECRQTIANIKNLDIRIEEKNFCHQCYPDTTVAPAYTVYVKYKGEKGEVMVPDPSPESLQLIYEFMNGNKTHSFFNDREEPLKDYIDRISELLKVKKP